jgi:hypothetical protein
MTRQLRYFSAVLVGLSFASAAPLLAQNLNIDLGAHFGTPSSSYAGVADHEGAWNALGLGVSANLVDLEGFATPVSANVAADDADGWWDHECPGDAHALRDDYIYTHAGTWTVALSGLANGAYTVYLYGTTSNAVATGDMTVNGVAAPNIISRACDFTGVPTFRAVEVNVTDGSLTISGGPAGSDRDYEGLAAVQLVRSADLTPHAGLWWNPQESGTGYNIDVKHGVLVLTIYSFKPDGDSEWYIATGALTNNGRTFAGSLDKARNGQCIYCDYNGISVFGGSDGAVGIEFSSPITAVMTLPGRTINIEPQAF